MIQPILQFRNADSTQDLNNQLAGFFNPGIISGGQIVPVANSLSIQVTPWKLIGIDGMVVMDATDTTTLAVLQNQTNVICFLSQYSPTAAPALGFQVLELSAYQNSPNIDYLNVFGFVTLGPSDTQVQLSQIDYSSRNEIDPVGRAICRGVLGNSGLLPATGNRAGDFYNITSGAGDNPAIYMWNGVNWLNITDTLTISSLLSAHRNNLFPNEIHLTDEQAAAALGTYGTPGVASIQNVTIDIPSGIVTLPLAPSPAIATGASIRLTTTGTLPTGLAVDTSYYAIALSTVTLQVASSYQNAVNSIPIVLTGTQTGTQSLFFTGNAYVTSEDPRVPLQGQTDALGGIPATPVPSLSNPFVTSAYPIAVPTPLAFASNPGSAITITAVQGPVFLGNGGAGTQLDWFNFFNATLEREYVNTDGSGVAVTGVYTDPSLLPQYEITDPSTTGSIDSDGFYAGNLYLVLSDTPDQPGRLIYGQRQTFSNLFKGALMQLHPTDSQTNQEVLRKFLTLSGRTFDTLTPTDETNLALRASIVNLRNYLNAVTAADLIVDEIEWARLREIPETAADFPLDTGETQVLAGPQTFTVALTLAAVETFDPTLTSADVGVIAIINYAGSPVLSGVQPGYVFMDGIGSRYRILAVNAAQSALMIYTQGATVSTLATPTTGQILQGNNPFLTEQDDLAVSFLREIVPIQGLNPNFDTFETLPPGGNAIGSGALAYTAIGTNVLPNQGNSAGAPAGRPVYQITPMRQGNRYDRRINLLGNWMNDTTGARRVIGNVSQGALGIDFTGRIQDLTIYTAFTANTPYVFQVFVDGVYNAAASQSLTTQSGLTHANLSKVLLTLRPSEVLMQPVVLSLGLSLSQIHNVRVEITSVGTDPFYLYGLGVSTGNNLTQEKGVGYLQTDIQQITTVSTTSGVLPVGTPWSASRNVRYLDRTTQAVLTAQQQNTRYYSSISTSALSGAQTLALGTNASSAMIGDVLELNASTGDATVQATQYRRIVSITGSNAGLDAPLTSTIGRYEYAYSIPCRATDGAPVLSAPQNPLDVEYARLSISDFDVNGTNDVADLPSSPSNAVTTLDDGSTSLLVYECAQLTLAIEGFASGVELSNPTSFMTFQAFCSRMDLVFCGDSGPATVQILVDGLYTYEVQLTGTGLERHTVFYNGSPQTHCIQISPSTSADAGKIAVGQFILHNLAEPAYDGLVFADYVQQRTGSASSLYQVADFASLDNTSQLVTSYAGLRIFDPTKVQTRLYDGASGGSYPWTVFTDYTVNQRFGNYLQAARSGSQIDIEFTGAGLELFIQQSSEGGTAVLFLDGVQFNYTNYPPANSSSTVPAVPFNISPPHPSDYPGFPTSPALEIGIAGATISGSSVPGSTVLNYYSATTQVLRVPIPFGNTLGSYGRHVLSIISTSANPINLLAVGEYTGAGQSVRRNLDDTDASRIHFSSLEDLRKFTTLLPDQVGLVDGTDTGNGNSTGVTAIPLATSGLIDLTTTSYQFGVYCDWSMDSDALDSLFGPADISAGFTDATLYNADQKSVTLSYDCTGSYTLSNSIIDSVLTSTVNLFGAPTWALQASDLVGALFQPLGPTNPGVTSRIVSAASLTSFQIEDVLNPASSESCGVKQCLYTKELVQFKPGTAGDNQAVSDRVPLSGSSVVPALSGLVSADINSILFDAEASIASGTAALDPVYGQSIGGLIAFQANIQGLRTVGTTASTATQGAWTSPTVLPEYSEQNLFVKYPPQDSNPQRLFLRIFPGPTTGSGSVNLLRWACLFLEDPQAPQLGVGTAFAYGYTDNSVAATGCVISVNSNNVTQINLTTPYDYGAFGNSTGSVLEVLIDGKVYPKYVSTVNYKDGYFNEVNSFIITLDANYSTVSLPIDIRYRTPQSQYIRIGTFNPLTWTLDGTIAVTGIPFDGARSVYEAKSFTRFKLLALNTGTSGTTTVELFQNGNLVATANLAATSEMGSQFTQVAITAAEDDLFTVQVTGVATSCTNLTVELS